MNPSRIFILRPVATSLFMIAILLAGALAFSLLPISALPEVDYPTIQVQTFYPGASPEVMTASVTAPLERQFGQMPSLTQMSSTSSAGASVITLQFGLTLALDVAEQEVQAAINAAGNLLPSDLPAPPIYAKVNPADAPILTLAVTSKTIALNDLEDLAETRLAQKISQVRGVGLVSVSGGHRRSVRVQANPRALAAQGMNLDDLRTIVANANVNTPKGSFDGPSRSYTIDANDQLRAPAEYRDIVVAYENGAAVRLSDVATVVEGSENERLGAWLNDTPAIIMNVQRQPGANVISVANDIKALLPRLGASLPAAVDVRVVVDGTTTVRASVADIELELAFAVVLVVVVMFVFLRSWSSTLIPSLSVPLSLVGTFGAMLLLGYSLNNLTLMALTVASGFVVDDAIVMIENVARYVEDGTAPQEAALEGSRQIGFTIISLTISLIAVLIPLLFMGDVVGRLFREFAVTLAVTILISAVVSLTLVPMMCARLLRHHPVEEQNRFQRTTQRWFDGAIRGYGKMLDRVLDHRTVMLAVFGATLVVTAVLAFIIPKGLFPVQDTGLIQAISQAPPATSYDSMLGRQAALAQTILHDPDVAALTSFVGVDGTNTAVNIGRYSIVLKPKADRTTDVSTVIRRLARAASASPDISLYMQPVQDLTIDATVSRAQYQLVLESASPAELAAATKRLTAELATRPELEQVTASAQNDGLGLHIDVDRDTAARFGITMATADNLLYDGFGQRIISTIFTQTNQYRVILEVSPALQKSRASLGALYLPSSTSTSPAVVPLAAVASPEERAAPSAVEHFGQFPSTTLSFDVSARSSLGAAIDAIRDAEAKIAMPPSVTTHFQGAARAFEGSLQNEMLLIFAAVVTMYIVLGVLYESFIHPLTILSTLPSAGMGALLALLIDGSSLGIVAIIGIVLLIGIVKKNAIMMIDFAIVAERQEKKAPREAIHQAALLRFRPIMMTTMAALLAALPLMLGRGTGSELRHPLGVTIVGGLIVSQLLTLFTTPVVYLAFGDVVRRFRGARP